MVEKRRFATSKLQLTSAQLSRFAPRSDAPEKLKRFGRGSLLSVLTSAVISFDMVLSLLLIA